MNQNESEKNQFNRREFIRNTSSFGALMALMGGVPLRAEDKPADAAAANTNYKTDSPAVSFGVIGCGVWGREIVTTLGLLPNAPVVALCDLFEKPMARIKEVATKAETFADYHKLLEQKDVEAVVVATPSHLHREVVEAALKAGKHVYCEAPLASNVDDARAIAQAGKAATRVNFQSGLQLRADPRKDFVLQFIRSGAVGKTIMARSQWHKKTSWRRSADDPDRERALNWRLQAATSAGLMGEVGIHQIDLFNWFLKSRPLSVTGFGGILNYADGRDVADTIQAVFNYPHGVNYFHDSTLASSYEAEYHVLNGSDGTVAMRDEKAWLFKEADAGDLGWEIYARKDQFYKEVGIALAAGASKLQKEKKAGEAEPVDTDTPLKYALEAFIKNSGLYRAGLKDFVSTFGEDADGLEEKVAEYVNNGRQRAAGWKEGFEATVTAIKANEAIIKGQKLTLENEWFEI